jgi:hypothetical protein
MVAIACIGVRLRTGHVQHTGPTESSKSVGGPSGSGQLSPGECSAEMISDGCTDANRKVLVKRFGEYLLPTAQA